MDKEEVTRRLFAAWARTKHLRFAQFLVNAWGQGDPFYAEDEKLVKACENYAAFVNKELSYEEYIAKWKEILDGR